MDRKEFIRTCTFSCVGLMGASALFESCSGPKYLSSTVEANAVKILRSEFIEIKKNQTPHRKYVVVKADNFPFPIVVFRHSENDFTALLLQCTHQGNELNVNGDILTCTAHGSEFSKKGEVMQGPADQPLKNFMVRAETDAIYVLIG